MIFSKQNSLSPAIAGASPRRGLLRDASNKIEYFLLECLIEVSFSAAAEKCPPRWERGITLKTSNF